MTDENLPEPTAKLAEDGRDGSQSMTRVSFNMNHDGMQLLRELMARHDTSATEVIHRAVAVLKAIDDANPKGGVVKMEDQSNRWYRDTVITHSFTMTPWPTLADKARDRPKRG